MLRICAVAIGKGTNPMPQTRRTGEERRREASSTPVKAEGFADNVLLATSVWKR